MFPGGGASAVGLDHHGHPDTDIYDTLDEPEGEEGNNVCMMQSFIVS